MAGSRDVEYRQESSGGADTGAPRALVESLTDAQREAVQHIDGPLLMLAGPGSGKTRVVTHRIAHLIHQGIPARQILGLTFTNKAADEMRQRLAQLAPRQPVWLGTFHRFCARLLRQHASLVGLSENFTIYDTDDSSKALKQAIDELDVELIHYSSDQIGRAISWAKNKLITSSEYTARDGSPIGQLVAEIYPQYQQRLLADNAVDFDDLLLHVAVMLRENPELRRMLDERFRYILVDEYQDTNMAQYAIVRALSVHYPNLAVTGDPDQSIYGWRGADLNNILDFEHDFPDVKVVRLEQNYRSTPAILRAADHLIAYNVKRKAKALFTANQEGPPVRLVVYPSAYDEAEHIAARIAQDIQHGRRPRDFAIFYRVNSLSRLLEHALRRNGVPYQVVNGHEFYQRREVKDVLAYLHLLNNPRSDVAFLRVVNTPPRGIGRTTLARLTQHARRYKIPLLDAARESGLIDALNKRAAVAVAKFVALYDRLALKVTAPVEELMGHVLHESGYRQWLVDAESQDEQDRVANIDELLSAAREFDMQQSDDAPLERFLEQTSLTSDTDAWHEEADLVSLITLHGAKGLEFPVVYIVGLEDGTLPHSRSREDEDMVEEERRLLFVGITRAERELQLSMAAYRNFRGERWPTIASPFLMQLPRAEMEVFEPSGALADEGSADLDHDEYAQEFFLDADEQAFEHDDHVQDVSHGDEPGSSADQLDEDASGRTGRPKPARLMTAAELAGDQLRQTARALPHLFHQGMLVTHPEFGIGKILALSGEGKKRRATVQFFSEESQRHFMVAHSPLQPAKQDET